MATLRSLKQQILDFEGNGPRALDLRRNFNMLVGGQDAKAEKYGEIANLKFPPVPIREWPMESKRFYKEKRSSEIRKHNMMLDSFENVYNELEEGRISKREADLQLQRIKLGNVYDQSVGFEEFFKLEMKMHAMMMRKNSKDEMWPFNPNGATYPYGGGSLNFVSLNQWEKKSFNKIKREYRAKGFKYPINDLRTNPGETDKAKIRRVGYARRLSLEQRRALLEWYSPQNTKYFFPLDGYKGKGLPKLVQSARNEILSRRKLYYQTQIEQYRRVLEKYTKSGHIEKNDAQLIQKALNKAKWYNERGAFWREKYEVLKYKTRNRNGIERLFGQHNPIPRFSEVIYDAIKRKSPSLSFFRGDKDIKELKKKEEEMKKKEEERKRTEAEKGGTKAEEYRIAYSRKEINTADYFTGDNGHKYYEIKKGSYMRDSSTYFSRDWGATGRPREVLPIYGPVENYRYLQVYSPTTNAQKTLKYLETLFREKKTDWKHGDRLIPRFIDAWGFLKELTKKELLYLIISISGNDGHKITKELMKRWYYPMNIFFIIKLSDFVNAYKKAHPNQRSKTPDEYWTLYREAFVAQLKHDVFCKEEKVCDPKWDNSSMKVKVEPRYGGWTKKRLVALVEEYLFYTQRNNKILSSYPRQAVEPDWKTSNRYMRVIET